ncbi:Kef-type potassium/proton antiporter accessory protein (CPA2 family) [Chitinophaga polysaccharea]|uniref:Kef-type potassium/proton antiporter accessory protein (CPA2 family) n=1 Tax=Chitinophaga polysaccharea TaxID=1293035 RepID=A0A561Q3I7_9BACT|nr:NAD(P)H-dependent oxidoreductase [Chitinophaga polysaccharea]TWF44899.1 Kef-type potassium/proton antiporter accessory protein (CPA2 family) [Chitinophaga polysaccharea]
MARVLINFAHPALEKSRVHAQLLRAIKTIPGITINDLYEQYPDLDINIAREQTLLEQHDIIFMQHPFYWYSAPAIVKQWIDLVLEHGWAYGHTGKALQGKYFSNIISAGGAENAYQPDGHHGHTIHDFLLPFIQTAKLCNMHYAAPYVIYGVHREDISDIKEETQKLVQVLERLRRPEFDPGVITGLSNLSQLLQLPAQTQ